jgi:hypothetical protein
VDYVGPSSLSVSQAAVFKVTVGNAAYYYEAGPSTRKHRPGWNSQQLGYSRPTLVLTAKAITIDNGLQIKANGADFISHGLLFPDFGKGYADVLLEVHAGPANQARNGGEWMEYSAPVVAFGEHCEKYTASGLALGESAVDVELGMAGTSSNRVLRFLRNCPAIAWSGTLFATGTFVVTSANDNTAVNILAVNPSHANWDASPLFEQAVLEYRFRDSSDKVTAWVADNSVLVSSSASSSFVSGSWVPPTEAPDGAYQIRIATQCTSDEADDAYKGSTTDIIDGIIDRNAPQILGASSSSSAGRFNAGDVLTVIFSETVVCSRFDTSTKATIAPKLTLTVGTESFADGDLRYVCQSFEMKIVLSAAGTVSFKAKFPNSETVQSLSVEISVDGIMDAAGNLGVKSTVAVAIGGVRAMETANTNQLDVIEAILVTFAGDAADAVIQAEQARAELLTAAKDAAVAAAQKLQAEQDAATAATLEKEEAAEAASSAKQALEDLKASDNPSDDEIDAAAAVVKAADATLAAAEEQEAVAKVNVAAAKDLADTAAVAAISAAEDGSPLASADASLSSDDKSASSSAAASSILIVLFIFAAMAYQHKLANERMETMIKRLKGLGEVSGATAINPGHDSSAGRNRFNSMTSLSGNSQHGTQENSFVAETRFDEAAAAVAGDQARTAIAQDRRVTMQNRPGGEVFNNPTYDNNTTASRSSPVVQVLEIHNSDDDMQL